MKKGVLLVLLLAIVYGVVFIEQSQQTKDVFSNRVIQVGDEGKDVRELQGRLKFLGYYTGPVDGDFSWRTYWGLRNFQYEFGLDIDGILGPESKVKLYNATAAYKPTAEELGVSEAAPQAPKTPQAPATQPTQPSQPTRTGKARDVSDNDLKLLANAVYGESRGEPYIGQVAVAAVILNRSRHPEFPDTPAGVIFEPGAFTAVSDGQIWLTPNATATKAVQDALNGWDPSDGAIYYFNPDTATSAWIWSRPQIKKIGQHIFCR